MIRTAEPRTAHQDKQEAPAEAWGDVYLPASQSYWWCSICGCWDTGVIEEPIAEYRGAGRQPLWRHADHTDVERDLYIALQAGEYTLPQRQAAIRRINAAHAQCST